MAQYLFVLPAISAVFVFAGFGAFFLCFVCLRPKQEKTASQGITQLEQMALDLSSQAAQLQGLRFWMFIEWLQCHCHQKSVQGVVLDGRQIWRYLSRWLETFPPDSQHSEYSLIMNEITWWKEADAKTLLRCSSTELNERNCQ